MSTPATSKDGALTAGDLRALGYALWERAWIIAAIVFAAALLAAGWLARSPRIYAATTTLQIEEEHEKLVKRDDRSPGDRASEEALRTIEETLKSPALLLRVARLPELERDPAFLPDVPRPASDARLQSALAGKIDASIRRGTRLIDVTAEDGNPALAQRLADALVAEFLRSRTESRAQVTQDSHEFLRAEAERLKATLAKSESALQRYREQHQAVSLDEKQNLVGERLTELNAKVTAAKAERLKLEADRAQFDRLAGGAPEQLLALPSIGGAPEVMDLRRRLGEKEAELAALSRRYRAEHPRFIQTATERQELQAELERTIGKTAALLGAAFEGAQATEAKLEEALRGQEKLALELSEMAIPYAALTREVESDRALYDSLLARLKETGVARGVSPFAVRVEAPATLPERPVRPNKKLILLLSLCGGAAVGLSLALGLHLLDPSLKTVDQAEAALGLRVLGAIPRHGRTKLRETRRLLLEKRQSALAESFRALRTELGLQAREREVRSVLFASSVPGEGKSFCSINHAVALAQSGLRTLLLDADLRLGSIGEVLLGNAELAGVSDVLRVRCTFDEAVHLTDIQNLSVMPAGARVGSPAELLGGAHFPDEVLRTALARFDRVVIDTAPVHAVSDTLLFARHADAVCLVIRAGRTPAPAVLRALGKLRESGAKVPGAVLNQLPRRGGYYYHYHAPGYGRDEVYGASAAAGRR